MGHPSGKERPWRWRQGRIVICAVPFMHGLAGPPPLSPLTPRYGGRPAEFWPLVHRNETSETQNTRTPLFYTPNDSRSTSTSTPNFAAGINIFITIITTTAGNGAITNKLLLIVLLEIIYKTIATATTTMFSFRYTISATNTSAIFLTGLRPLGVEKRESSYNYWSYYWYDY